MTVERILADIHIQLVNKTKWFTHCENEKCQRNSYDGRLCLLCLREALAMEHGVSVYAIERYITLVLSIIDAKAAIVEQAELSLKSKPELTANENPERH